MPEVWELTTRDSLLGVDPGIHDCAWNCDTGHKRLMPGGIRRLLASARRHATSLAYCNSGIMHARNAPNGEEPVQSFIRVFGCNL